MTSNNIASEAMDFLDSYRAAFERFDTAAVADHFAFPSYIASDADDGVILSLTDRQDCCRAIEKVTEMPSQAWNARRPYLRSVSRRTFTAARAPSA